MKNFYCFIKSHCDAPDFETEIEAKNKEEASVRLANQINRNLEDGEWSPKDLLPFLTEV